MTSCFSKYILQSNTDGHEFEIDSKIIEFSDLLKKLCNITQITNPIGIDCPSETLKTFITLISHYQSPTDKHDLDFEKNFFQEFDDVKLAQVVKEICILDSDFVMDSIADAILDRIKELDWKGMQEYIGLEDDFSEEEREWMAKYPLEYLISLNAIGSPLRFPLACQNFYSLKSKFQSPMNVILARVCQRSNEAVAFYLAQTCRVLKNECDRHPIKLSELNFSSTSWKFLIRDCRNKHKIFFKFGIEPSRYSAGYFAKIVKRKLTVPRNDGHDIQVYLPYPSSPIIMPYLSLKCIVPQNPECQLELHLDSRYSLSLVNLQECLFNYLWIKVAFDIDYDELYQFVAKDFSKRLEISTTYLFGYSSIRLFKKSNAEKFDRCILRNTYYNRMHPPEGAKQLPPPEFKLFIEQYMEPEGYMQFGDLQSYIPEEFVEKCVKKPFFQTKCKNILKLILKQYY